MVRRLIYVLQGKLSFQSGATLNLAHHLRGMRIISGVIRRGIC